MHLIWPFFLALIVLGVIFWYANGSDIIQPWKSVVMIVLVLIMAIVLLRFVGVNIPLGLMIE